MVTVTYYVLFTFGVSLTFCANDNISGQFHGGVARVYQGWAAKLGDVPYQISFKRRIRYYKIFASFCGGIIIEPAKLLSAAHCFTDEATTCERIFGGAGKVRTTMISPIVAVAGQLWNMAVYPGRDSIEGGQWRRLKSVYYPPDYSFPKLDIAIVFLRAPFKFNTYVNSIPYASKFVDYDGKCVVSGFGQTSPSTHSDKLLLVHLTLIPWRRCNQMYQRHMHRFVCTSSQFTDVGKGDSGGPLVCAGTGDPMEKGKGVLVGIVSGHAYGVGSFFTRVSTYYKYIESNKSCNENIICLLPTLLLHCTFLLF